MCIYSSVVQQHKKCFTLTRLGDSVRLVAIFRFGMRIKTSPTKNRISAAFELSEKWTTNCLLAWPSHGTLSFSYGDNTAAAGRILPKALTICWSRHGTDAEIASNRDTADWIITKKSPGNLLRYIVKLCLIARVNCSCVYDFPPEPLAMPRQNVPIRFSILRNKTQVTRFEPSLLLILSSNKTLRSEMGERFHGIGIRDAELFAIWLHLSILNLISLISESERSAYKWKSRISISHNIDVFLRFRRGISSAR